MIKRQAIKRSPEDLQVILDEVLRFPKRQLEELAQLLRDTTLSSIIGVATVFSDRLKFHNGLEALLFDPEPKKRLKERSQLHRIVAQNWRGAYNAVSCRRLYLQPIRSSDLAARLVPSWRSSAALTSATLPMPLLSRFPSSLTVPLIVACALFMENMDSTVIATSLPALAIDLHENPIALKLALTSYIVSLAVFIPISGWMSDRFGSLTVFRSAIGVFMLGSIFCGVSNSLGGFVVARFFQGMGGAMMVPVGRLVILRSVTRAELVKSLSYLTIPALIGPVIGPPLGGFITTYFHWRWIFFINIPISILGICLATKYIGNFKDENVPPLDFKGFLYTAVGFSLLMLGLATAGRHLVSDTVAASCVVIGSLALVAYTFHARRLAHPLIDFRLLRTQTFRMSVFGGAFFRIGVGAIPFLLPLMLQLGFGLNPFQSGLLTCASAVGALTMKTLTTKILRRAGFRNVLIVNAGLGALSVAAFGLFTASTPHLLLMAIVLIGGCVRSLQFTSLNAIAYADIDKAQLSQATSIASVAQQLAIGMGVTVGGLALQASNTVQGHAAIVSADFWPAFLCIGIISALSIPFALRLPKDAGAELSGRSRDG